jgi:hypothetical protein
MRCHGFGSEGSRHEAYRASPVQCAHGDDAKIDRKGVGEGVVELHTAARLSESGLGRGEAKESLEPEPRDLPRSPSLP